MSQEKQFLVSVADAYLFDTQTDQLVMKGKTLISTALEQAVSNTEIFGGKGSMLQYDFNYQKMLTITVEDSQVREEYIALNNNTQIANELRDYYIEENVVLDAGGAGTLEKAPIGNVYVEASNGSSLTLTPTGSSITVSGHVNQTVKVVYRYQTSADHIVIDATKFPKAYKLVLNADFFTKNGKSAEMQITVPEYKLDGNFSLELTNDGVSTFSLNGKALADNNNAYAHVDIVRLDNAAPELVALAALPTEVQLSAAQAGDSEQLTVYGIRGGNYANILMNNADLTFTSDDAAVATVNTSGVVTLASPAPTAGASTVVRVTNGTHTDTVQVDII